MARAIAFRVASTVIGALGQGAGRSAFLHTPETDVEPAFQEQYGSFSSAEAWPQSTPVANLAVSCSPTNMKTSTLVMDGNPSEEIDGR